MIKVCHIITRLNVGGPARHVAALTERFPDSHIIYGSLGRGETLLPEAGKLSTERLTKVECMSREIRPLADYRALHQITENLKRLQPMVVHTHTSKAGFLGRLAALRAGVPVIVHTFHGHVFHSYFSRPVSRAVLEIERWLARKTDAMITLSASQLIEFLKRFRFPGQNRFHIIPVGLDLDIFEKLPPHGELRKELRIPDDAFVAGFIGRLEPVKQPEIFIEIISRLKDVHGVFVGAGTLEPELRRTIEDRGLSGRVHFAGWRDNLPEVYADIDAVALTSRNEGTPVALIEAAASRLPVVAFRVGGVDSVVYDPGHTCCSGRGQSGFLVSPGNVDEMTEHLKLLARSPDLCRKLGNAGHDSALPKFGFEKLVRNLEELYDSLAGQYIKRR